MHAGETLQETFTVEAVQGAGDDPVSAIVTINIRGVGADSIPTFAATITPQIYPISAAVSVTLPAVTGGDGALTYAINPAPPLPTGLAFDGATRVLSGTTTATEQAVMTYTYTATDSDTVNPDSVEQTFTIAVIDSIPTFGTTTIAPQTYPINNPVNVTLPAATGGNTPVTYAITGDLPAGLAFDGTTRVLDGTPTTEQAADAVAYTYTATDGDPTDPDTTPPLPFTIAIADLVPVIVFADGSSITVDEGAEVTLDATGSSDPENQGLTYLWEHTLTDGVEPPADELIMPTNAGTVTATFTAPEERTRLTFRLTLTDGTGKIATDTLTVQVGRTSERALQKTLAAFGRAFAADAVDVIGGHLAGNGTATANRFTLGGQEIDIATPHSLATTRSSSDPDRSHSRAGGNPVLNPSGIRNDTNDPEGAALALENQSNLRGNTWQDDNPSINYLSTRALLEKSAFHYNLSDSGNGNGAPSIWGRATHGNYEGKPDNFTLDGNLSSAYLGLDFRAGERRQAGVAVSYTEGRVNYTDALDDSTGDLDAELTSVLPYMRYTTDGGLGVWGLLGYGTGDARLRSDDGDPTTTDIEMLLAAAGVRGTWLSPQHQELAWKASVFAVEMESEAVASQELPSVDAESQRLRLAIEGRARHEVPGSGGAESAYLAPTWELGLRWDDGDAESGIGADLGLGLQYDNPASGWNVQARGRYLLVHEEGDYEEWSASMEARKNLGNRNRGLALTLTPDWNQRQSSQRVGLDFSGLINTDGLRIGVYGERHQRKDDDAPGHEVGLSGELRF